MSFECLDCQAIDGGYCTDCATPNDDLRELLAEWRARGVVNPYGMTWHPPADELEAVMEDSDAGE
jgi:hypothetical protein